MLPLATEPPIVTSEVDWQNGNRRKIRSRHGGEPSTTPDHVHASHGVGQADGAVGGMMGLVPAHPAPVERHPVFHPGHGLAFIGFSAEVSTVPKVLSVPSGCDEPSQFRDNGHGVVTSRSCRIGQRDLAEVRT